MFDWFKKRQNKAQLNLLFQNSAASMSLAGHFDLMGQTEYADRMRAFEEQNRRIASTDPVTPEDQRVLLDMSLELSQLFDMSEATDPLAKVRELMTQPPPKLSFDEKFKPLQGWKEYYKSW